MIFPTTSLSCITLKETSTLLVVTWLSPERLRSQQQKDRCIHLSKISLPDSKKAPFCQVTPGQHKQSHHQWSWAWAKLSRGHIRPASHGQFTINCMVVDPFSPSCYTLALCSWHPERSKSLTWLQRSANQRRTYLRGEVIFTLCRRFLYVQPSHRGNQDPCRSQPTPSRYAQRHVKVHFPATEPTQDHETASVATSFQDFPLQTASGLVLVVEHVFETGASATLGKKCLKST